MTEVASLPMYDLPEVRRETDALWQLLAAAMRRAGVKNVPDTLTRVDAPQLLWERSDLLFSQTCGFPLTHQFKRVLRPVATPRYAAPGCVDSNYCSAIVVHDRNRRRDLEAFRGTVCAINSRVSQSGYNALRALVAPLARGGRFFAELKITGGHLGSIERVASGAADICAVDCVTHALLERYRPSALKHTRVMAYTPSCPGLPFVSRADFDPDQFRCLRMAVQEALRDPSAESVRSALLIDGMDELDLPDYQVILDMESDAVSSGYAEIR